MPKPTPSLVIPPAMLKKAGFKAGTGVYLHGPGNLLACGDTVLSRPSEGGKWSLLAEGLNGRLIFAVEEVSEGGKLSFRGRDILRAFPGGKAAFKARKGLITLSRIP